MLRAFIIFMVILAISLVIYRGWFYFSTGNSTTQSSLTVTVNKPQIQQDTSTVEQNLHNAATQTTAAATRAIAAIKNSATNVTTRVSPSTQPAPPDP